MGVETGLDYLNSLKPWTGSGEFDLRAISQILERLDNPQDKLNCIHVAGTNGKGSVCANISAILQSAGHSVGLTTSPHLNAINERIAINGRMISDAALSSTALKVRSISEELETELSFFEAITVCAFQYFLEQGVDWAVVEVGLGGRLDATNVIRSPRACAIVSIDLDHQTLLGETIAEISTEKAGILKQGIPVFTGRLSDPAASSVSKRANELSCTQIRLGHEFDYMTMATEDGTNRSTAITLAINGKEVVIEPALKGNHQRDNACIAAALCLHLGCAESEIQNGLRHARWPGRLEELDYQGKRFLLDAAHNPAGIKTLISFLHQRYDCKFGAIFGVLNTKNWQEMLDLLVPYVSNWYIVEPRSESAVPARVILDYLSGNGINGVEFGGDYCSCLSSVLSNPERGFVVAGSIYMIGAMRAIIYNNINKLGEGMQS